MTYTPYYPGGWANLPLVTTPIIAAALQNMENGLVAASPLTTLGDLLVATGSGVPARLAIGTSGQVLTVSGGIPTWVNAASGFANPMTTAGDLLYENTVPAAARLAIGTSGQVLTVSGGAPAWQVPAGSAFNAPSAGSGTVFSDTFTSVPAGSLPDPAKWCLTTGTPGSDPTNGSQYYAATPNVVAVNATAGPGSTPALVFQVQANGGTTLQQTGSGTQHVAQAVGNYVSARITTMGTDVSGPATQAPWALPRPGFVPFTATYGTLTVVAKVTPTAGFWPAIWLLGAGAQWPGCGEIDVMENFGGTYGGSYSASKSYFNVIGPRNVQDYNGADWEGNGTGLNASSAVINDGAFHTYTCQISSDYSTITVKMDGTNYANSPVTKTAWLAAMSTAGYPNAIWPFGSTSPLAIMMNVAVGSVTAPAANVGYPSASLNFPVTIMTVASVAFSIP